MQHKTWRNKEQEQNLQSLVATGEMMISFAKKTEVIIF